MTIWKYTLKTTDEQTAEMPRGAQILTVQTQGDTPMLWALVDPGAPTERRTILTHGTGHEVPDDGRQYLGTYQRFGGQYVFHVFEPANPTKSAEAVQ